MSGVPSYIYALELSLQLRQTRTQFSQEHGDGSFVLNLGVLERTTGVGFIFFLLELP